MTTQDPSGVIVVHAVRSQNGAASPKTQLRIVVDGQDMPGKWCDAGLPRLRIHRGQEQTTIPVTAGSHRVKIFFHRGRKKKEYGVNQVQVDVTDGTVCKISYASPWFGFMKGPIRSQLRSDRQREHVAGVAPRTRSNAPRTKAPASALTR